MWKCDLEIYWLRLNPGCAMSQLCDSGQHPPSKPQSPHLENDIENLKYLVSNLMYFICDEKN